MTIHLIVLIASLNHAAFTGSRVAVALYALHLGANQAVVGALVALYSLCPTFLSIYIGKYADRTAPRLLMLAGTAGLGLGLLLQPLFPGITVLFVSSFLVGFWNQLCNIPLEAVTGGIGGAQNRARNYAWLGLGLAASTFLGPVIAGVAIDHIGHVAVFPILAALTIPSFVILWFMRDMLPPASRHASSEKSGSVLELWRIPALRTTLIAGGVIVSAWDLFQFYLPIYGHSIGLSATAIGTIIGMVAVASFVIRAVIPFLIKTMTEAEMMTWAILGSAVAFILLPFFQNAYALGAIAFLLGLGVGCGQPISQSLTYILTPKGRLAESTGLRKTINQGTHLVVPLLFGGLGTAFGFVGVFTTNSLLLIGSAMLMRKSRLSSEELTK